MPVLIILKLSYEKIIKNRFTLHPFLFGLFPILFIYAQNAHHMSIAEILTPSIVIILSIIILILLVRLFYKDKYKTGIISSLFVLSFFSWRAIFDVANYLADNRILGIHAWWKWIVFVIIASLILLILYKVKTTKGSLDTVTSIITKVALILIVVQIATGG